MWTIITLGNVCHKEQDLGSNELREPCMNSIKALSNIPLERELIGLLVESTGRFRERFPNSGTEEIFTDIECRNAFADLTKVYSLGPLSPKIPLRLGEIAERMGMLQSKVVGDAERFGWIVRVLRELSCRRELIAVLDIAKEKAINANCKFQSLCEELVLQVMAKSKRCPVTENHAIVAGVAEVLNAVEERYQLFGKPAGIRSGFRGLDLLTSGFLPGRLYLILGKQGVGKTSLAINLACSALRHEDAVVGFSASKQTIKDILTPLVWQHSEVDMLRIAQGAMDEDELELLMTNSSWIADGFFDLRCNSERTLADVRAHATQVAQEKRRKIMIVDDIQDLISVNASFERICAELRSISISLKIPLIASAGSYSGEWKNGAETCELRDPDLEADAVIILDRDGPEAVMSLVHNVDYSTASFDLEFDGISLRFKEAAAGAEMEEDDQ